jgi:YVTN family beta-propeller protein
MRRAFWVVLAVAAIALYSQRNELMLSSTALLGKQAGDYWIVATNQLLRPWGQQSLMQGRPIEAVFDSKKRILAVLNSRGVNLLDGATGTEVARIASRSTSLTGLAFRPGDRELWASEATRTGPDSILVAPLSESGIPGEPVRIALAGHPVPMGIAFAQDGATAYVAMSDTGSIAVIDAATRQITRTIPVGNVPYSVAISHKRKQLYVSNRGGRRATTSDTTAPSAATAVVTDPVTGASRTGSISVIDLNTSSVRDIEVGLAPAGLVVSPDENTLAVVNAHSDSVTLIDLETLRTSEVKIPAYPEGSFGSTPSAAVFSPDGARLYVACGGTNAITVLTKSDRWTIAGAVPAGWFPTSVAVDADGGLRVVNVKGVGSNPMIKGGYNSRDFEGSILRIPPPQAPQLHAGLREVIASNAPKFTPAGGVSDLSKLGIEHVFLIIKENRTYDQVYGDMPRGNGDPKLVMYGREITPNHHALADQFVLLDNFYTGGAISFDGHQWLMQGFVSDYVERSLATAPRGYAWNLADSLVVAPTGFFWQDRNRPIDVRLYGPFSIPTMRDPDTHLARDINESKLPPWSEYWRMYKEGKWQGVVGHRSGVPALQKYINPQFPPSTMNIPDQMRADAWLAELAEREKTGKMPNLLIFTMTSDHTMGTRPGFPTPRAMMADNDLALGNIVEGITKSRFWPKSLILVTEDDAQDGVDHVDGRRTIALVIGPNVKRGVLDSNHYNHSSLIRTTQDVFRIKPRVRYAASARAMTSVFTTKKDLTPYKALTPNISLTEMNPPLKALRGRQLWAAQQSMKIDSSEVDEFPAQTMNRILWWDAKGYSAEYPRLP